MEELVLWVDSICDNPSEKSPAGAKLRDQIVVRLTSGGRPIRFGLGKSGTFRASLASVGPVV
jgi:hypothetical protein